MIEFVFAFLALFAFFAVTAIWVLRKIKNIADRDLEDYLEAFSMSHRVNLAKLYCAKMQLQKVPVKVEKHKGRYRD